jgi:Winged helix DNA-binding domain
MTDVQRRVICVGAVVAATALVDGRACGMWRIDRDGSRATLVIEPLAEVGEGDRAALADEGARLLAFAAADANDHDVRFEGLRQ